MEVFFLIWHLAPNPSLKSVAVPFLLTFKGQFLPGIELFSTTKCIGPILDLPWVCLCYSTWERVPAWALDAQPGRWWQHRRVRMGSASSSWAWASLGRKTRFGGRQGNVENSSRFCKLSHRTWLMPLSLGKGRDYTAFCLGWQRPQTASPPQHMVWSVTICIHFCAIIFSGTCAGFKETEEYAGFLWIASKLKW